jgi:hypothetical protein
MEAIDIYSPQKMIFPGTTNIGSRKRRRILAESISRNGSEYQVHFNATEAERMRDFIDKTKIGNISAFALHFTNSDKFIESIMIAAGENHVWTFQINREGFILANGDCDEI